MKKLFVLFFSVLILITSSGFGLIGSSTIVPTQLHQKASKSESDKMKKNQNTNIQEKKNTEKNQQNQVAQSLIQWIADGIKSTLASMAEVLSNVGKTILTSILHLFH